MRIRSRLLPVVAVAVIGGLAAGYAASLPPSRISEPDVPPDVRTALQDRRYPEAARRLDRLVERREDGIDYWLYLEGLAQHYAGEHAEAIAILARLEREHPESTWLRKARFTRAEAHLARREYEAAERIYEAEARRLMAQDRKEDLARRLIAFGDKLAAPKDDSKPDSQAPDYGRAYELYRSALEFEIGPALRDEVMFKLAATRKAAQQWQQAVRDYEAYLSAFDPDWPDAPPEVEERGAHVFQARFELAEAHGKTGRKDLARRALQDLVALADAKEPVGPKVDALRAAAMYGLAATYNVRDRDQALLAVKALADYLARYAAGADAVKAAFEIGAYYEGIGRHEDAAAAFGEFLARKGFRAETDEARQKLAELTMEAKYRLGRIYLNQKRYDGAREIWNDYIANHPAGPHWSLCQQGIIEADYRTGADLRAQNKHDEARDAWDAFLKRYPLDPRARQIMYEHGQMALDEAGQLDGPEREADRETLYRRAVAAWEKLVSKYPNTEESSHAQFMMGQVYETRLKELERAIEEYRKCTWGSWAPRAAQRIAQMTDRQLTVLTERTWRTGEPARIKVQMRNIESLTLDAYRLDLEDYFRKMHRTGGIEQLDTLLIDPDETWEVKAEGYARYKPIEQEIEIPFADDEPGAFAVRVTGGQLQATTLVLRSDLDVIVKSSKKALLVFAEDMAAERAWADVRVIASDGEKVFYEGATGPDGVLYETFEELKEAGQVSVLAVVDGHVASNALDIGGLGLSEGLSPRGYIYTDRPAYRPGQTVRIRAILREVEEGGYVFEEGREYTLEVVDSQGRVLDTEKLTLSGFGTMHHGFALDPFAPTGDYTVRVRRPNGPTFSGTFQVERYRLEPMELTFDLERRIVFRGEPLAGRLLARYYYGEPVAGRQVEYFLPDGRRRTAVTDRDGEVAFSFDTTPMLQEQPLVLRAGIVGENVRAQTTAFLAVRAYGAAVSVLRGVYLAGEPFEVMVSTRGVEGEPVGRPMTVKALRRESQPDGTWAEVLVAEKPLATDEESGDGAVSFALEEGGQHILRAEGADHFGNPITAQAQVLISGAEDAVKLRILADRQRLKVGETATVRLHSRLEPAVALLTYEGEEIIGYEVVRLARGENPVRIEVRHEHFPNFALGAAAMVGNRFHSAAQSFVVERELKVAITADAETYEPGQRATVTILTTDQSGRPVPAELSLAAVDESLFGQFPDRMAAVGSFFQEGARRVAALATTTSCTFSYRPETQPVPDALISEADRLEREKLAAERRALVTTEARELAELQRPALAGARQAAYRRPQAEVTDALAIDEEGARALRRREAQRDFDHAVAYGLVAADRLAGAAPAPPARVEFPETAYWNPAVVTDAEGRAELTLTMPDSTTKWRLTARGVTSETLVGQQTATVVTRKDFFVELKLPSVVTEGDAVRVTARVHNLTDFAGPVSLKLDLGAGGQRQTMPAELSLDGEGVVEHVFEAWKVPEAEGLAVTLEARAGRNADALSRQVPIRPWGVEVTDSESGLVDDSETFYLELPAGGSHASRRLTIVIDPGLDRALVNAALGGGPIPLRRALSHGPATTADTAGELLGVVSVMEYLQALGRKEGPEWRPLAEKAEALVATLTVTQRDDGGWSWGASAGNATDPYTSSRAVWALVRARALGAAVPARVPARGVNCLKEAFSRAAQQDNELKATLLHALAVAGEADFGFANRLYRLRNELSPSALAHTALTLALLDRGPMAGEVLDVLEARKDAVAGRARPQSRWPADSNEAWMRSDLEMTALALLAYLRVRPEADAAREAAEYLLAHRPWRPRRSAGPVLAALSLWFAEGEPAETDYHLTVRVNEQDVDTFAVRGTGRSRAVDVPAALVRDGRNRVDLELAGRGRPSYTAVLSGFRRDVAEAIEQRGPFYVNHRGYDAAPPEYSGRPVPIGFGVVTGSYRSWTNKISQLESGQVTTVSITIGGPRERLRPWMTDFLIVRVPVPAGASVVDGSVSGRFDYYHVGDAAITLYVARSNGYVNVRYALFGRAPGSYRSLPVVVESAYAGEVLGVGAAKDLTVLARGQKSSDPYNPTPDELYHLGRAYYEDGHHEEARVLLEQLFDRWQANLRDEPYRETARMLLFISIENGDARKIVRYFEVIKERYPDLVIPFDKVLAVGDAYRQMEEFERAMLVFKATVAASFIKDAHVGGVLEAQGQPLASVEFMKELHLSYPDTPTVTDSYLSLADTLYELAGRAGQVEEIKERGLLHDDLMLEAVRVLVNYLTVYPENPQADDAGLNLVNAYLKLEDFESTVKLCRALRERFPESPFLDSFEYVEAVAQWNLGDYAEAIGLAQKVAETVYTLPDGTRKPSDNRDLAVYIVGQIWHARGEPEKAIEHYRKVEGVFADAAEAIQYFERKDIALEEVTTFAPGKQPAIALTYRNIPDVHLLVYRVDLMTLYLTEKNLSRITRVNLAGIEPALDPMTVRLGDGKDYAEKERELQLKIDESGAYLVIARGGDLHSSGMVLVTPLKLEVQEDPVSGRVRVNVMDRESGRYLRDVHVKVIGSENRDFRSGQTDLRGIFVADGVSGRATVIARDGEGQFAFYRGETHLMRRPEPTTALPAAQAVEYMSNVERSNLMLQQQRKAGQKALYGKDQRGVQTGEMW